MANETGTTMASCSYVRSDGSPCPGAVDNADRGLCFWHDVEISKEIPGLRERLQEWAHSGESMEGFDLRYAPLEGLKLSTCRSRDLRRANLFRANLQGASMFNVNLQGAELLKANLAGANLNQSRLEDADLLGANLDGTRLDHIDWGELCINEQQAIQAQNDGDHTTSLTMFKEAEEVYRALRRAYTTRGENHQAGLFFRREMIMQRMQMPRWSAARAWSVLVDLLCAYGESPPRVIISTLVFNFLCALVYFFTGILGPEGMVQFDPKAGLGTNLVYFSDCLYYSITVFTSLAYNNEARQPWIVRPLAGAQAFLGTFMMALFVVVFAKKMMRN